jgi:hypothetical protein
MGNIFYLDMDICGHCNRARKTLKIGVSSPGRAFLLNVCPDGEPKIRELSDWLELWKQPGNKIRNDMGETLSPGMMMQVVANRVGRPRKSDDIAKTVLGVTEENTYFDHHLMMFADVNLPFGEFGKGTYQLIETSLEVA